MTILFAADRMLPNPLDLAEQLIMDRDWAFDRPIDEELLAEVTGHWCGYRIWFTWQQEMGVLIFSCSFDNKVPLHQRQLLYPLLSQVNEKLWLGHFELCSEEGALMFRHALLLRGGSGASTEQLEDLLDIAVTECDRFYPAFQSVIWGGKTEEEALAFALMDTVGEA